MRHASCAFRAWAVPQSWHCASVVMSVRLSPRLTFGSYGLDELAFPLFCIKLKPITPLCSMFCWIYLLEGQGL